MVLNLYRLNSTDDQFIYLLFWFYLIVSREISVDKPRVLNFL